MKYVEGAFEVTERVLPWQAAGRTWTATGYGAAIPTRYMIRRAEEKVWRRVYAACYSNAASYWVKVKGERFYLAGEWIGGGR